MISITINAPRASTVGFLFGTVNVISRLNTLSRTSLSGHGLILKHFRQNECGVTEELPPIEKNLKYDFNYQVLM